MSGTAFDHVKSFVERLACAPVCVDCIAQGLNLPEWQHANYETRDLAGMPGLEMQLRNCVLCDTTKEVIRLQGR